MSEKTKQSKQTKQTKSADEVAFYLHELREHSKQLFGVKPEVVDGAFLSVKETKISKDHAQKLINDFLKKEVN